MTIAIVQTKGTGDEYILPATTALKKHMSLNLPDVKYKIVTKEITAIDGKHVRLDAVAL